MPLSPKLAAAAVSAAAVVGVLACSTPATALPDSFPNPAYSLTPTVAPNIPYGLSQTYTETVRDAGRPVSSGRVVFTAENGTLLSQPAVNAHGQASISIASSRLGLGLHTVFVSYVDAEGVIQADDTIPIDVIKNQSDLNWSPRGNGIPTVSHLAHGKFNFVLTAPGTTPTGWIRVYDGRTLLGSAELAHGRATVTLKPMKRGLQALTFTYSGDSVLNTQTWTNNLVRSV